MKVPGGSGICGGAARWLQPVGETGLQALSAPEKGAQGRSYDRGVVPEEVRIVPLPEVQEAVAVLVLQPGPRGADDARREGLYQPQGVAAAVYLAALCLAVKLRRARAVPLEGLPEGGEEPAVVWKFHGFLNIEAEEAFCKGLE